MSARTEQIEDLVGVQDEKPGRRGSYRVEYLTADGGGHIVLPAGERTEGIVEHAVALLREQGVDARVRRIVPLRRQR